MPKISAFSWRYLEKIACINNVAISSVIIVIMTTGIEPVRYRELLATICEMEAYWDYDRFKKCSKCELKAWCQVCPAVASRAHRDFYNIDP